MQHWNAQFYDTKHAFVFQYGEGVVELLNPQPHERILDVGAGTGHLAKKIADLGACVTGIDSSAEMVAQAQALYPELAFYQKDGADFQFDEPFDAVFSNATLHWIHTPENVIACVYNSLRKGGRFVAEFGGKGNVQRILEVAEKVLKTKGLSVNLHTNYFPSLGEYATLLEKGGFRVTFATHFDRDTELEDPENGIIDWLRMFRGDALSGLPDETVQDVCTQIKQALKPTNFRDGKWFADYKRLRFVAIKE